MKNVNTVRIKMWGTTVGYLHQDDNGMVGFQYDEEFLKSNIEISPVKMPLSTATYTFPALPEQTFHGLPGMVADSLPDKFGNIVINRYLESQGRTADSLSVIEKLCYTGKRGMGALEYEPSQELTTINETVDLDALTKLASEILSEKEQIHIEKNDNLMAQLMECGSSVGGARAKTLIAWNPETNDIRSGQINAGKGYEYWLLKFDNIKNNKDKDSRPDDGEYTKVEYAYYLMALDAGIEMSECRLYKENGSAHFMTKRFDRKGVKGEKLHMQSLCALAHMDFNSPRVYSYEAAFAVMKQLKLPYNDFVQLFRRMVFNEYAKNYDDHTKNISFLMDKKGVWSLSPAYDVTFSYRKDSIWVSAHQMLINGKSDNITKEDMLKVAEKAGIKKSDAIKSIEQVINSVSKWEHFAEKFGMSEYNIKRIKGFLNV
ncbi:MAG: type II toxin-antitoxin system HipA family toxin [Acutalibacteraceae bacterium]|nr:type II toxin-antitoxin system HipA family toxin [Oscillospiraceae bacterium]